MAIVKDQQDEYIYFLYSSEQENMRTEIESKANKIFVLGQVYNRGDWRKFTMISKSPTNPMFADSIIVAEGYKSKMKYHDCSSRWKVGM